MLWTKAFYCLPWLVLQSSHSICHGKICVTKSVKMWSKPSPTCGYESINVLLALCSCANFTILISCTKCKSHFPHQERLQNLLVKSLSSISIIIEEIWNMKVSAQWQISKKTKKLEMVQSNCANGHTKMQTARLSSNSKAWRWPQVSNNIVKVPFFQGLVYFSNFLISTGTVQESSDPLRWPSWSINISWIMFQLLSSTWKLFLHLHYKKFDTRHSSCPERKTLLWQCPWAEDVRTRWNFSRKGVRTHCEFLDVFRLTNPDLNPSRVLPSQTHLGLV